MASLAFLMMKPTDGGNQKNSRRVRPTKHDDSAQTEEAPSLSTRQRNSQPRRTSPIDVEHNQKYQKEQHRPQHSHFAAMSSSSTTGVLGTMSQSKYSTEMILQYPSSGSNRRRASRTLQQRTAAVVQQQQRQRQQQQDLLRQEREQRRSASKFSVPPLASPTRKLEDDDDEKRKKVARSDLLSNHRQGSQGMLAGLQPPSLPPSKTRLQSFFRPPPFFSSGNYPMATPPPTETTITADRASTTTAADHNQMTPPPLEHGAVRQPRTSLSKEGGEFNRSNKLLTKRQSTADWANSFVYKPPQQTSQQQLQEQQLPPVVATNSILRKISKISSSHTMQSKFSTSHDATELYNTFRTRSFQVSTVTMKLQELKLPIEDDQEENNTNMKNGLDTTNRSNSTMSSLSNETSSTAFWHATAVEVPPNQAAVTQRLSEITSTSKNVAAPPPNLSIRVPTMTSTDSASSKYANPISALNAKVSVGTAPPPIPTVSIRDLLYESGLLDVVDDYDIINDLVDNGGKNDTMPLPPIRKDTPTSHSGSKNNQDLEYAPQKPISGVTASSSNHLSSFSSMTSSCSKNTITTSTTLNNDFDDVVVDFSAFRRRPGDNDIHETKDDKTPIPPLRNATTSSKDSSHLMSPIRESDRSDSQDDGNNDQHGGLEMTFSEASSGPIMVYSPPSVNSKKFKGANQEVVGQEQTVEVHPQEQRLKHTSTLSASSKSVVSVGPASDASSKAEQRSISKIVDRVLHQAVRDLLSMDDQQPLCCTCVGSATKGGNAKFCSIHGCPTVAVEPPAKHADSLKMDDVMEDLTNNDIDLSSHVRDASKVTRECSSRDQMVSSKLYPDMPTLSPDRKLYPDMPSLGVILEAPSHHSRSNRSIMRSNSNKKTGKQSSSQALGELAVHADRSSTGDDAQERDLGVKRVSINSESSKSGPCSVHYKDIPLYEEGATSLKPDERPQDGSDEVDDKKESPQNCSHVVTPLRKKSWQSSQASSIYSVDENEPMEFEYPLPEPSNHDSNSSLRGLNALPIRISALDSSHDSLHYSNDSLHYSSDSLHYSSSTRSLSLIGADDILQLDPTNYPLAGLNHDVPPPTIDEEADTPVTCNSHKRASEMTTTSANSSTVSGRSSTRGDGLSTQPSISSHEVPVNPSVQFEPAAEQPKDKVTTEAHVVSKEHEMKPDKSKLSQDSSLLSSFSTGNTPEEVECNADSSQGQEMVKASMSSITESVEIESQEKPPMPPPKQGHGETLHATLPPQFYEKVAPSFVPTSIVRRLDSLQTVQSTMSEVTVPWELKSPMIKSPIRVPRGFFRIESPMRGDIGGAANSSLSSCSSMDSSDLPPPPLRPFRPTNSITPSSPEPNKPSRASLPSGNDHRKGLSTYEKQSEEFEISLEEYDAEHLYCSRNIPSNPSDVMTAANDNVSSTRSSASNEKAKIDKKPSTVARMHSEATTICSLDENNSMKFDYAVPSSTDSLQPLQTRPIRLSALSESSSIASDYWSTDSSYVSKYSQSGSFQEVSVTGVPQFDPTALEFVGKVTQDGGKGMLPPTRSWQAPRAAVPPPDVDEVNTPITCNSHKRPTGAMPSSTTSSIVSEFSGESSGMSREELMLSEAKTPISRNSHKRIPKQSISSGASSLDEVPEGRPGTEEEVSPKHTQSEIPPSHLAEEHHGPPPPPPGQMPEDIFQDVIQQPSSGGFVPTSVYGRLDSIRTVQTAVSEVTTPWELKTPNILHSPMKVPRGIFRMGSSAQISLSDSFGSDSNETTPPLLAVRATNSLTPLSPGIEPPTRVLRPSISLTPASPELAPPNRILSIEGQNILCGEEQAEDPGGHVGQSSLAIQSAPPSLSSPQNQPQRLCFYPPSPYGNRKSLECKSSEQVGPAPVGQGKGGSLTASTEPISSTSSSRPSRCDSPGLPTTGVPNHKSSFLSRTTNLIKKSKNGTEAPMPELPFGDDAVSADRTAMKIVSDRLNAEPTRPSEEELVQDESDQQLTQPDGLLRVKHHLDHICFIHDGYACIREGFYSGALDDTGDMHGNGVFWFAATDDLYLGEFAHGELHGIGALSIRVNDGGTRKSKRQKTRILKGHWEHNEFMGEEEVSS